MPAAFPEDAIGPAGAAAIGKEWWTLYGDAQLTYTVDFIKVGGGWTPAA